jgi:2-polyprenyl-6-methoxyphenol hydroxylase-like FAD-dependent oxidoreductase
MKSKKIAIIGGGIGGLTTAIALQQKGFDVKVYEAAPEIREVGAGLWIAPNAINIFERLGIAKAIKSAGNQLHSSYLGDHKANVLTKVDFSKIIEKYDNGTTAIHRGKLQSILLKNVKPNTVETYKRLKNIETIFASDSVATEGGIKMTFEDGTVANCDILIGADGIHSVVRKHLFGEMRLRYSGQTCWRGVAKMALKTPKEAAELWGTKGGLRTSYSQISGEEVYWYITAKAEKGTKIPQNEVKSYLLNLVSEFQSDIQSVIEKTDNHAILQNDLLDLKAIPTWYKGNVVLIGDAAHATTPNLGQGACQAIEDAYYLAHCLSQYPSVNEAFSAFQRKRKPKADFVTKTSFQMGQVINIGGAIGYRLRNILLKMTPSSIGEKQFDYLFRLDF